MVAQVALEDAAGVHAFRRRLDRERMAGDQRCRAACAIHVPVGARSIRVAPHLPEHDGVADDELGRGIRVEMDQSAQTRA